MGELSPGTLPSIRAMDDRLDSWKEIAVYLGRDVTTVQRWEKREGMPVHRHLHERLGSVSASRAELDAWVRQRSLRRAPENGDRQNGISGTAIEQDAEDAGDPPPLVSPPQPASHRRSGRWKFFLLPVMAALTVLTALGLWLQRTEYFWRNPIAHARFQTVTDFDGVAQAAAISRDGHLVAFQSDRDGQMDIWVTQVDSGQFHNLTHGSAPGIVNPSIRTLGFSPDASLVTFWVRRPEGSNGGGISVWAVPTLGGPPRPYLEGVAEFDWSLDGARLAYHTPGPGDPLFVSDGSLQPEALQQTGPRPIFTAPAGTHSHFPLWSADAAFVYFVEGSLPDKLDIWRIPAHGGEAERITSHHAQVSYPVLFDRRTLLYLAAEPDGSGPFLYSVDTEHHTPHRLTWGLDRYTSLAASADGHRLVATLARPKRTLWRLRLPASPADPAPAPVSLPTGSGFSPRLGPDFLLYVSENGTGQSIWKYANGAGAELWRGEQAQVSGGPEISPDGRSIAFSVSRLGQTLLYVMQADGTNARVVSGSLNLQGSPAWTPDGQAITSAVVDHGVPHLYRIPVDGSTPTPLVHVYSADPRWAPDGRLCVYSGPDVGATFSVKAMTAAGAPLTMPALTLTRGARRMAFLPGGHTLVALRGEIEHKNLWLIDLDTGAERQLTNLPPNFDLRDFDISPDGRDLILERVQERSDVVLLDIPRP